MSHKYSQNVRISRSRLRRFERLEDRKLLASDCVIPWDDTNMDGFVTPFDGLVVINALMEKGGAHRHNPAENIQKGGAPKWPDATNDGWVTPHDALRIFNVLNERGGAFKLELSCPDEILEMLAADVAATHSVTPSITKGDPIFVNAVAKNMGPDPAKGVVINIPVPVGATFVPFQNVPECVLANAGNVQCTVPSLENGMTKSLFVRFDTTNVTGTTISTRVSVTSTSKDPVTTNNQSALATTLVTEIGTIAACGDGIDNDGDGKIDFPADAQCANREDDSEFSAGGALCSDGIDNDGDGATDFPNDFSCNSPQDNDELLPKPQCNDNIDNDGDGGNLVDYPADPGCINRQDNDEFNLTI